MSRRPQRPSPGFSGQQVSLKFSTLSPTGPDFLPVRPEKPDPIARPAADEIAGSARRAGNRDIRRNGPPPAR